MQKIGAYLSRYAGIWDFVWAACRPVEFLFPRQFSNIFSINFREFSHVILRDDAPRIMRNKSAGRCCGKT